MRPSKEEEFQKVRKLASIIDDKRYIITKATILNELELRSLRVGFNDSDDTLIPVVNGIYDYYMDSDDDNLDTVIDAFIDDEEEILEEYFNTTLSIKEILHRYIY